MTSERHLESMIDTYQNLVFSICYQMTKDYFQAEDLTQETFLAAYRNYSSFDGRNEKAWICRIASNKCLDYLRKAERKSVPAGEEAFLQLQETKQLPEKQVLEQEVKEQLYERCSRLSPPYDEIARDYFYYEMTPDEISIKRNRNKKTVQTQIYRAKAMLRKWYGKERTG